MSAQIKLAKNFLNTVKFPIQFGRSYVYLSSQADQWDKSEFRVSHVWVEKTIHVSSKHNGTCFSIFLRGLTVIFSGILYNLFTGSVGEVIFQIVFKILCCSEEFLVINFCTFRYSLNIEKNLVANIFTCLSVTLPGGCYSQGGYLCAMLEAQISSGTLPGQAHQLAMNLNCKLYGLLVSSVILCVNV